MTTVNYPNPVMVNGYSCKNCAQVDEAKKHIDPSHPQDGPFGVLASAQPPNPNDPHQTKRQPATGGAAAVTFGGALSSLGVSTVNGLQAGGSTATASANAGDPFRTRLLDISV